MSPPNSAQRLVAALKLNNTQYPLESALLAFAAANPGGMATTDRPAADFLVALASVIGTQHHGYRAMARLLNQIVEHERR